MNYSMTWANFYLICFAVGFCLSFFSFVFGGARTGRLHLPHFHGHVGGTHPRREEPMMLRGNEHHVLDHARFSDSLVQSVHTSREAAIETTDGPENRPLTSPAR